MKKKKGSLLPRYRGFTLIEIIVVLLITSILLFLTTNFLKNVQKISIRSGFETENTKEIVLFKKILQEDLSSFIPTNIISDDNIVIDKSQKLLFSSVFLDINEEELARKIIWEITDNGVVRKISSNLQSKEFVTTHSFEKLGNELFFELFYEKKWYQDFIPTRLFFRPQSIKLIGSKDEIISVINAH